MVTEIAAGVYMENAYEGGNVGLVATARGALLVDTPMLPPDARRWQLELMQMGCAETYGIVNTDYHPEHFLGNAVFMPTRTFGNKQSAKPIAKYETSLLGQVAESYRDRDTVLADEIKQITITQPEISVQDSVTLHIGEEPIRLLHLEGHTPASLGLYLPAKRVLFAGDNITNNEHPALYQANSLAWLDTLRRIREMDIDVIVPGEGKPCGKEVIDPMIDYITEMRSRVTLLFDKGASRRECVDKVGMLDWFPVQTSKEAKTKRRRRESVERVYTEVRIARRKR